MKHLSIVGIGQHAQPSLARSALASARRAVVLGSGPVANRVCAALSRGARRGVALAARFDDRASPRAPEEWPTSAAPLGGVAPAADYPARGALADAAAFVRQGGAQEVYLALPLSSRPRLAAVLQDLQDTTASIYYVPDAQGMTVVRSNGAVLDGLPVVDLCESPFHGAAAIVKRAEDLVLASAALLLLWPLMLAIALAVRMDSPGPALFRQRRVGLDGREIEVWKFRTMHTRDDGNRVIQARRGDPRITRLGALLRRTSLDELPQFINVLQGRMSVVGPRPHALSHHDQFRREASAYMVRHKVRPGITGLAQVRGHRGETDTPQKLRDRVASDLEYLSTWSLGLDLRIVARTAVLVLGDRCAY